MSFMADRTAATFKEHVYKCELLAVCLVVNAFFTFLINSHRWFLYKLPELISLVTFN